MDSGNDDTTRLIAERLFEAFRAVGPFKRRPGFGHAARPGEFQLIHRLAHEAHKADAAGNSWQRPDAGSAPDAGLRVGDLAAWLGVKPPTVTQLVDALESRGLVERFADTADRRAIRVRLSTAGKELAGSFHSRAMDESEALVAHLGTADSEKLAELLSKAAEFLGQRHGRDCSCHHHGNQSHQPGYPFHVQEGEK
ncbi:MAG: MarR family winged helix-turn-helix transcriptional regulator [Clostridia bacterium]|jgi:DNA-binding MarR family transcriptional regulator|nr:MarR family transcriptional regulator [Spirochaetia bacterium]